MNKSKLVVGLMSGTSLDGISAVLLRVRGSGTSTWFRQVAFAQYPFPRGMKELLLRNSMPATSRVDEICRLNFVLAELYAESAKKLLRKAGVKLRDLDLIGSHGQTIHHLPNPRKMFGKTIRSTLQIGDPSVLATLTGVCTVGDFRVADMAVGGQGAPLVPYFDWLVFRSGSKSRILLNIGGIANITVLPKSCTPDQVLAFDTGPGNMVVDALMQQFFNKPFDHDGEKASQGTVSLHLLKQMAKHPYLRRTPPKSTGREEFGMEFISTLLKHAKQRIATDIVATASRFTAFCVHDAYNRFVGKTMKADEIIVSGGGARNRYILAELNRYFAGSKVRLADEFGVSSDAKEAICFAILANETIAGNPANMLGATGARKRVVLGKICRP